MELGLKRQFGKCVDFFANATMIAVRDVVVVAYVLHDAEVPAQGFGKLVGTIFQRSTVQRVVNIFRLPPFHALIVHVLHDLERQRLTLRVGMAVPGQVVDGLIETGITKGDGRIAAIKQLVDLFALFQPGQRPILPHDRGDIGGRAQQMFVADAEGSVAKFQGIIENIPEPIQITAGTHCRIGEADGHDALIDVPDISTRD